MDHLKSRYNFYTLAIRRPYDRIMKIKRLKNIVDVLSIVVLLLVFLTSCSEAPSLLNISHDGDVARLTGLYGSLTGDERVIVTGSLINYYRLSKSEAARTALRDIRKLETGGTQRSREILKILNTAKDLGTID